MSNWRWNTKRAERLPSNWHSVRSRVLSRDGYVCQICHRSVATEVDHIVHGDNHDLSNLQGVCSACHRRKTQAEAAEAQRRRLARRYRPVERHPGVR